ncbi:ABC transporter permease [Neolewinella agarilytica]|uniref:Peptide/nickel transport system permease protein n=1 Tax=Neolewinella agarilytica TaxID=478744 RepID=A0A1H9EB10_9BACT|nr:ABC transporter permease [Neolewinella agarilytica]SEQ22819.1 peptide/nickel transport system permease protein [Neolewinella agarilytica]
MLSYALRRLLYLPLSLFLLSLLCFGLRAITPGDPVESQLPPAESRTASSKPAAYDASYRRAAAALGYDLPTFYFSLNNAALPDTLHRIGRPAERRMLRALTLSSGNWPAVQDYYLAVRQLAFGEDTEAGINSIPVARRLLLQDDPKAVAAAVNSLPDDQLSQPVKAAFSQVMDGSQRHRLLLPAFRWHGAQNQYHHWLLRILSGDFGNSYLDRRPVASKIGQAMRWTILLNGIAILLVYLVSLPVGLYAAGYRGSRFDRYSTTLLFILFGLPSFWIATLVTNYFTTPAFGMDFFPSMGFGDIPDGASWWTALKIRGSHLFLPVMCLAYPSFAYVSRHLRRSAVKELDQAYVTTARLKGLSRSQILWKHVLRNASFPIITLLGGLFPALLAGSVLIERIFNLPGMGQLLYTAAVGRDWPIVITLVLLNGLLTAAGLLLADLAYAFTDPRVRLGSATTFTNNAA